MKASIAAALVAAVVAVPGAAQPGSPPAQPDKPKAEIVSYGADGKPEVVRAEGQDYKLCKGGQTDGCINPRDAGFDWGGKEIDYWPGRPASEIGGPLPEHKPDPPKGDKQPG